jgi:hypothetical protein
VLFDHFGFVHVLDHFALLGSDIVGLLDPDAIDVLLMLSSVESSQLATLNSFVFIISSCVVRVNL